MYAKNLKLNRGVDNTILFQFLNQDQKPVDIANATFTFRVISQDGTTLLLAKDLVSLQTGSGSTAVKKGQAKVTVTATEMEDIPAQPASYSLEREQSSLFEAVFVDDNAGARGYVDVVDSVYPDFVASQEIAVTPKANDPYLSAVTNVNTYFSDQVITDKTTTTFQLDFDQFSGNVQPQGTNALPDGWTNIGSLVQYTAKNSRDYINVTGNFKYLRLKVEQSGVNASATATIADGAVTSVSIAGAGSGYSGAPRVRFISTPQGSGATANATVSLGSVASMTLINGGAGYTTLPNVVVDSGAITSIKYR